MNKAIGYARVSTAEQADSGLSLEAQRAKIRAYCQLHDLELVEIIEDGATGKHLDRPGVQRVLKAVRGRHTNTIVIAKLDRITRSVQDLGTLLEVFARYQVAFASVAETLDTSTAAGRLVLHVMGSVAQWEREAIAERTSDALSALRARGRRVSRHAPYGYRHTSDGKLREHTREQAGIRLARQLRLEDGLSLRKIATRLQLAGYASRAGTPLSAKTVRRMILEEVAA